MNRTTPSCLLVPSGSLPAALQAARARSGVVQTTFALPAEPWDLAELPLTCVAEVAGDDDVTAALMAALRGADLAIVVAADLGDVDRFDDESSTTVSPLSPDQQQILTLLAQGASLPAIAEQLFLSLRTTERRLSAARRLLGAQTTAEAVLAFTGGSM